MTINNILNEVKGVYNKYGQISQDTKREYIKKEQEINKLKPSKFSTEKGNLNLDSSKLGYKWLQKQGIDCKKFKDKKQDVENLGNCLKQATPNPNLLSNEIKNEITNNCIKNHTPRDLVNDKEKLQGLALNKTSDHEQKDATKVEKEKNTNINIQKGNYRIILPIGHSKDVKLFKNSLNINTPDCIVSKNGQFYYVELKGGNYKNYIDYCIKFIKEYKNINKNSFAVINATEEEVEKLNNENGFNTENNKFKTVKQYSNFVRGLQTINTEKKSELDKVAKAIPQFNELWNSLKETISESCFNY